ncbi:hypothetical protein [uncultured Limosilactobacillus sp.]|nr:hypothetical protein [uncultured Limosilactobacillus sp.]
MTAQLVGKPLTPPFISKLQFIYPRKRGSYQLKRLADYLHN